MKIKLGSGLLPLNLLILVLVVAVFFASSDLVRILLGLPFVLFFTGYSLVLALFPRKESLDGIERTALGFGLSVAISPLIGLILNYTPWGITVQSVLFSLWFFIVAMSVIGELRLRRLPQEERLNIQFTLTLPIWRGSTLDKALSIALVVSILGAIGALGYVLATPKPGETLTEFYILGREGKAADYPQELKLGKTEQILVGIVNREYRDIYYRLETRIDGILMEEMDPIHLQHEQKWEEMVDIVPVNVGENQKLEFFIIPRR